MQIICNRITKITNGVDKVSKRNFTKLMGCNNNKIATLEFFFFFLLFQYYTNIFESTILFIYKGNNKFSLSTCFILILRNSTSMMGQIKLCCQF